MDGAVMAELPAWDLRDLYAAPDAPGIEADFAAAEAEARALTEANAERVASLGPAALAGVIAAYERVEERLGKLVSYAQLRFAADATDAETARFAQSVNERATRIGAGLLFLTLEINRIEDAAMEALLADPALRPWAPWLRDVRVFRPHDLSDEAERLLHEKSVSGRAAWTRLFDETVAGMSVKVDGEALTVDDALNRLSDRDRARREAAARGVSEAFGERRKLFGLILNTLMKDKQTEDEWRRYSRPGSQRNRSNMVEDAVVDALVSAVRAAYPRLSHRYYALKAKWLGLDRLQHWDRNAPLPGDDDRRIGWDEARGMVLDAYGAFSPEMAGIAARFFDKRWIDAPPRPGKTGGAFSHPVTPSAHPYVMLNYHGRTRDVMTLAHELGHGVHQCLAGGQGYLKASTPLTLAETASVFGEMLTFQALLDAESDARRRRLVLAAKVEDMLNTVVRQTAFHSFETRLHDGRRAGELTADEIGAIWLDVQRESLGPTFEFTPDYAVFWSYIPHFVHTPFYVYAYAFGDCLVNALYAVYRAGQGDFERKYLDMLRAGGSKRHRELLAPFGLDASDPAFWRGGLDVIAGHIDTLEAMDAASPGA